MIKTFKQFLIIGITAGVIGGLLDVFVYPNL